MDVFLDAFLKELTTGLPDAAQMARVVIRLVAAALLGAVVGMQRESADKSAGVRTHMLIAMGATLFMIAALESGMSSSGLSRVIQGLATGIGFIGGGAILKLAEEREVEGLTTAAGIWLTAAVGVAVGLGLLGMALLGIVLAWIVLAVIGKIEERFDKGRAARADDKKT